MVDDFTEKHGEILRVTRGYRPQRVCALVYHLSFLCFPRKIDKSFINQPRNITKNVITNVMATQKKINLKTKILGGFNNGSIRYG